MGLTRCYNAAVFLRYRIVVETGRQVHVHL